MARSADPLSYATVVTYVYNPGIPNGVLRPDDSVVGEIEDALQIAERSGDDFAVAIARMALGVALVNRHTAPECDRGQTLLAEVSDVFLRGGHNLCDLPIVNVYLARERARRGDRDEAIPLLRTAADHLFRDCLETDHIRDTLPPSIRIANCPGRDVSQVRLRNNRLNCGAPAFMSHPWLRLE